MQQNLSFGYIQNNMNIFFEIAQKVQLKESEPVLIPYLHNLKKLAEEYKNLKNR